MEIDFNYVLVSGLDVEPNVQTICKPQLATSRARAALPASSWAAAENEQLCHINSTKKFNTKRLYSYVNDRT